jgi:lipopolysaccharide export LptBFGC system permease protein LptF
MSQSTSHRIFQALVAMNQRNIRFLTNGVLALQQGHVSIKVAMVGLLVSLAMLLWNTWGTYEAGPRLVASMSATAELKEIPSIAPLVSRGIACFLALIAAILSFWVTGAEAKRSRDASLIVTCLWFAAAAGLAAWLPADIAQTMGALSGKALAGETPSIAAYFGMLGLISLVLISIPVMAMVYFRLGLMDRYVVHNFLSPFSFSVLSFISIIIIGDLTDNGGEFSGQPLSLLFTFYIVQIPFMVVFATPIAVLLSGLFALGKMSKSNEVISMIGAGRSVVRILMPLFVVGAYASMVCLAFKFQWAPASVGYKDAMLMTARQDIKAKRSGDRITRDIWAKRGWMHVNEADRRTWFVGKIPYTLSDEMADLFIFQMDEDDQPDQVWIAERAHWVWNADPSRWVFEKVRHFVYDENQVPRITAMDTLEITDWSETPWKVLSSSQNPEYLGIPGLTMYLNANRDFEDRTLAPFRTNWWYVFAEPWSCMALILVSAPLGIVYSRRGSMAGVTGAIVIFALMYLMRGTLLALGQSNRMMPFFAAWSTNFAVAATGLILLWFRARNRELPTLKKLISGMFRSKRPA